MPLGTIVVECLSHRLHPYTFSIHLQWRGFHALPRQKLWSPRHFPDVAQHPIHPGCRRIIATATSRRTWRGVHTISQQLKSPSQSVKLRDQEQLRRVEIGIAYQNLRQIALGANYRQTQECVRILVEERGEKPNLRLYDALLLANADHEHGSASEVARILEEIKNEGLTPDSATYHAILRVNNEQKTLCKISQLIVVAGPRHTSGLPSPTLRTRATTPTMVSPYQRWLASCSSWTDQRSTARDGS